MAQFADAMATFAPFEPHPKLAVAVSGGADSMALTLLTADWARRRGAVVTGLTVDHRLRAQARGEAHQVKTWLAARGIAHQTLRLDWDGSAPPTANMQNAARAARYRRLGHWCARHGVLHLLVAHHLEDQAETFLLRLGRGSGIDGLAAMAPVSERHHYRILRPLLFMQKARLTATLARKDQDWIEDPSNRDMSAGRARLRAALPALGGAATAAEASAGADTLTIKRLAQTAAAMARGRTALDAQTNERLSAGAIAYRTGLVRLDRATLRNAPEEIALRMLARALMSVGGAAYPPRFENLRRLHRALVAQTRTRTLAGCKIVPQQDALYILREPAAAAPPVGLVPGARLIWDGRFEVTVPRSVRRGVRLALVGQLGASTGRRVMSAQMVTDLRGDMPAAVVASLPVLAYRNIVFAPPCWGRTVDDSPAAARLASEFNALGLAWTPVQPLTALTFAGA